VKRIFSVLIGVFLLYSSQVTASENQAGLDYWNGIDKEAITTSSGLQYKALIMGTGRNPKGNSKVTVHYRGLLLNGVQNGDQGLD